jgi:hypothetical protein
MLSPPTSWDGLWRRALLAGSWDRPLLHPAWEFTPQCVSGDLGPQVLHLMAFSSLPRPDPGVSQSFVCVSLGIQSFQALQSQGLWLPPLSLSYSASLTEIECQ